MNGSWNELIPRTAHASSPTACLSRSTITGTLKALVSGSISSVAINGPRLFEGGASRDLSAAVIIPDLRFVTVRTQPANLAEGRLQLGTPPMSAIQRALRQPAARSVYGRSGVPCIAW